MLTIKSFTPRSQIEQINSITGRFIFPKIDFLHTYLAFWYKVE